jgi:AcrR family transcriptional regulator
MNVHSEITAAVGGRRRGRPAAEGVRERILAAALRVFAERGYHGTAVPDVADAARVSTGSMYRHFPSKEALVNEVFRAAKARLGAALLGDGLHGDDPRRQFDAIWRRLVAFARAEPLAFRFLEMQDHAPYLDEHSRATERAILEPIAAAGAHFGAGGASGLPVDAAIAFVWGAAVGLFKAERLGYLTLTDEALEAAGEACWRAVGPRERARTHSRRRNKR